ncbi:hypothetical protein ACNTMW_09925 [Planosporangium sp. 12N6]|uniref:hypothetical protein n=1 Tax=Planosporangium spinosum TaxID=3402278 RepID=UPI003CEECD06
MTGHEPPQRSEDDGTAQQAADRLALALEDVGFDVGREFPLLGNAVSRNGLPVVILDRILPTVATRLAHVIEQAARAGVTLPGD